MKLYKNEELVENKHIYYEEEPDDEIFCMSNLRGCKVAIPHKLPFSFYFSPKMASHAIRVKPMFNPNRVDYDLLGTLELHGDWQYTPGPNDKHVSNKQIREMKEFFKTYKVLFAGVWDKEIPEDSVQLYFQGHITFHELLQECYFYEDYQDEMDNIKDVREFESFVRENRVFNMWD